MDQQEMKQRLLDGHEGELEAQETPESGSRRRTAGLAAVAVMLLAAPMLLFPTQLSQAATGCLHMVRHRTQAPPTIILMDESIASMPLLVIEDLLMTQQSKARVLPRAANSSAVCETAACKQFAGQIKANMAKNYKQMDPCVDFSAYVCDGWRDTHDYRPDQSSVSIGSVMSDTSRDLLHAILDAPYSMDTQFEGQNKTADEYNFKRLKTAYDTCMDEAAIKRYGVKPVADLLDELDKVYPRVAPEGVDAKKELTDTLVWLAKQGVAGLVSDYVTSDDKNPDLQVISVGSGSSSLPSKEYYNKTDVVANFTRTISNMFEVITSGKDYSNGTVPVAESGDYSLAWSKNIVELERKIANASPDPAVSGKPEYYYKPMDVSAIDAMVPEISITDYLTAQAPKAYQIKTVILSDTYYYGNLSSIIKDTPRETLNAYFRWNLIRGWNGRLHKDYSRPARTFNNQLAGRDENAISDRWRTCISEVDNISGGLGWLLSSVYVQKAFSPEAKAFGDRIIRDIRAEFVSRLQKFDWMTDEVKKAAEVKVKNVNQKIGYPTEAPDVFNPIDLQQYYAGLNITPNFFENGRQYTQRSTQRSWNDLLKPTDRRRWEMSSPTVNAYYSPSLNEIVFPAGIMQLPSFALDLPEYVSYGAFGSVAGHELTHGFDDNGSKYDETGRYKEWWDNTTQTNFNKRADCFVDQFSKYSITQPDGTRLNVNGKLTEGENIADAGGISASFSAWQRRQAASPNQALPGLEEFTPEQMFYVSYSTWWCGKVRPAQAVNYIYTDPHSPAETRILGTTANAAGFREAFNCPVKEPTCVLW